MWNTLKDAFGNFPTAFNKRREVFRRLFTGETVRRRAGLGSDDIDGTWSSPYYLHTSTCFVTVKEKVAYTKQVWGTVRYKLDPSWTIPPAILADVPEKVRDFGEILGHFELRDGSLKKVRPFSRRFLEEKLEYDSNGDLHRNQFDAFLTDMHLGLNSHSILSAAWELAPWSWLTDWFVDIGATIDATNNTVPLVHSDICVMRTLTARRDYDIISIGAPVQRTGQQFEARLRKERYLAYPLLPFSASIPWLTQGQWSILGSLAVIATDGIPTGPRSRKRRKKRRAPQNPNPDIWY
jgi:hypothetical protein